MAAIANLDALIGALADPTKTQQVWFDKCGTAKSNTAAIAGTANQWKSTWLWDGNPACGLPPTTAVVPTNTTQGALGGANPVSGDNWLVQLGMMSSGAFTFFLVYDRLLHVGGLSGTSTGAQTVGGTLTRYTNGIGNFAFTEIYTAIGGTGSNVTMSYTNEAGTSGRASIPMSVQGGGTGISAVQFFNLQAGDRGIQAIATATLSASTTVVGDWGVTIGHPLALIANGDGYPASVGPGWRSMMTGLPGLPQIFPNACLGVLVFNIGTGAVKIYGMATVVEAP